MTTNHQAPMPLTPAGHARLREELETLRLEREPAARRQLRELRESANPEDMEVRMALEELTRVQQRIREIERLLASVPLDGSAHTPGTVTIGSRVTARDETGRLHEFVLVSPLEASTIRGHVSTASPVGAALLGRRPGDQVQVKVPAGLRVFKLLSVE